MPEAVKTRTAGPCEFCGDTGTICLACRESITECECAEDSMPCTCNACGGRAALKEAEGERS